VYTTKDGKEVLRCPYCDSLQHGDLIEDFVGPDVYMGDKLLRSIPAKHYCVVCEERFSVNLQDGVFTVLQH
jgi:hypothetical protein